jgi:Flp pilus assembly protein TadD
MNPSNAQSMTSVGEALAHARQLLARHPQAAAEQARQIIAVEPDIAETYLILAAALRAGGQDADALAAEKQALHVSTSDPILRRVAEDFLNGRFAPGEALLRRFLDDSPNDPEALRLLGQAAAREGHLERAEQRLRQSLMLAPRFAAAKHDLDELIEKQAHAFRDTPAPAKPATPPMGAEEFARAVELNQQALSNAPEDPKLWLGYGHVLRIAGRQQDSIEAYRKAVELDPAYGEAWWSLADLKTVALKPRDITHLAKTLSSDGLSQADRTGLLFALGKALGDAGQFAQSFEAYAQGNALKRNSVAYDAAALGDHVRQCESVFTRDFFDFRVGQGVESSDPIFIVGMSRSGSTLVEQILASHPSIEGTEELVYMGNLANLFAEGRRPGIEPSGFVEAVASASPEKLEAIGGAYMWKAATQRRSSRPHFIDKMPRNWIYLPLVHLALPNARIIDMRRHPMDCCWSNYRQLFADSGEFSYDLNDLGSYYRNYVRMMQHFDAVLPGRVHRIIYEELIDDTEQQVRGLLDYLGVPFDPACMLFHDNPRSVKTSSSEQVRRPISKDSVDQWRPYAPWLQPLEQALGPVLDCYPQVPAEWD